MCVCEPRVKSRLGNCQQSRQQAFSLAKLKFPEPNTEDIYVHVSCRFMLLSSERGFGCRQRMESKEELTGLAYWVVVGFVMKYAF